MPIAVKRPMYFVVALVFLYQGIMASPLTLIGHIDNDLEFYYREFTTFPSLKATIEYHIMYNYTAAIGQCSLCYPRLEIYTTKSDANLDRNCSVDVFGQLRNEDLHTGLKPRHKLYRFTNCTRDENFKQNGYVLCHGKTKIQDYIPRNYGFSFGHRCEELEKQMNRSLKGLQYNMTIYGQTNKTQCYSMDMVREEPRTKICAGLYSHMSLPNLVGIPDWKYFLVKVVGGAKMFEMFMLGNLDKCYPYIYELLCYLIVPKCDPENRTVVHPCKEMCEELRAGCQETLLGAAKILAAGKQITSNWKVFYKRDPSTWFDCNYLPSKNGTIPCIYKPVVCQPPPNVTNAVTPIGIGTYQATSIVSYSCDSDEFHLEGNSTVTCKYSGEWSEPPKCVKNTVTPLVIVLPLLIFPFVAFLFIIVRIRKDRNLANRKFDEDDTLSRNKEFDAYVCYDFEEDNDYVMNHILPQLEENENHQLKMCIHTRDFIPGKKITRNIETAICKSNSAIIVMSQAFLNSGWCKEEFEHCNIESREDRAFRLFVIMMQPLETLNNFSKSMKHFTANVTYLEKDDPELFDKIAKYLKWVKEPKPHLEVGEGIEDGVSETESFLEIPIDHY